jgi:hypothetical protein
MIASYHLLPSTTIQPICNNILGNKIGFESKIIQVMFHRHRSVILYTAGGILKRYDVLSSLL